MSTRTLVLILFFHSLIITHSFFSHPSYIQHNQHNQKYTTSSVTSLQSTWQEKFDQFVDIDTSCDVRKDLANDLLRSFDKISNDVISAIKENNVEKLAPPNLNYGKNLKSAKAFRKQLVSDIIPDFITNQIPKLITEAPTIAKKVTSDIDINKIQKRNEKLISYVRDLTQDPSMLQSTVDDLRKEVKNVFKSTPDGLYTPSYQILKSTITYEIRQYQPYSVVSTSIEPNPTGTVDENDMLSTGNSFNELAGYILSGENENSQKLSMTTPVIMGNGKMDFILPNQLTSSTAPKPKSNKLKLVDVNGEIVAVKTFSGIPTEKEIARQRAMLEDALLADGIVYENLSFKTLTYNPPYTLPWLRRNEVSLRVDYKKTENNIVDNQSSSTVESWQQN